MRLIERLQRLDERLGLDGPQYRREQEQRRAALAALPQPARRSLTRLRIAAILGLCVALVGVGLFLYTSIGDVAVIVLGVIAPFCGIPVGRWLERHVLEKHAAEARDS